MSDADRARFEASWGVAYMPDEREASPERLAYEARERGDQTFQIDLVLRVEQAMGGTEFARVYTRTKRIDHGDVIGRVEAQGWRLEHVSTSYATVGTHLIPASSYHGHNGHLVAFYVFRRRELPA
jgi:hypothetical protein